MGPKRIDTVNKLNKPSQSSLGVSVTIGGGVTGEQGHYIFFFFFHTNIFKILNRISAMHGQICC
jgi:hypothetical protein